MTGHYDGHPTAGARINEVFRAVGICDRCGLGVSHSLSEARGMFACERMPRFRPGAANFLAQGRDVPKGRVMPYLRTYNLFISHAWDYNDDYYRLVQFLNAAPNLKWKNLSVPEHDPLKTDRLEYELRGQMRDAHAFLILSGMYVAHSEWIGFEIDFARRIGRPIIGIRPWGSERIPAAVEDAATAIVGWNTDAIVRAIRTHALES